MLEIIKPRGMGILLAAMLASGTGEAVAGPEILRVSAFIPARSVSVSKVLVPWIKEVEQEAAGQLKFQGYWGGALGRNPKKQYDLVRDGVTDAVWFLPSYTPGLFPDLGVFELPFLVRDAKEGSEALWRMYRDGVVGGLDETHVVGVYTTEAAVLHAKSPIKSLADVKGLKLRAGSASQSAFIRHLGGTPIGLTVSEMTEAMSRGLVDAGIFTWGGAIVFKVHNIAKHHYWAPMGAAPQAIVINKEKWNALSGKAKAAINKFSGDYIARLGGNAFDGFAARARKIMQSGGSIIKASEPEIRAYERNAKPIYDAWIAKHENGEEKFRTLVKTLADIRSGK